MLLLEIKIVPFGEKSLTRTIQEVKIVNVKTTTDNVADYKVTVDGKKFEINGHKRNDGFWPLIHKISEKVIKGD